MFYAWLKTAKQTVLDFAAATFQMLCLIPFMESDSDRELELCWQ